MMTIVKKHHANFVDDKIKVELLPTTWERCSVSGEMRPPEEFMRDGVRVRTNCTRTYQMPFVEMQSLGDATTLMYRSPEWRAATSLANQRNSDDHAKIELEKTGVPVDVLIQRLQELPKDAKIVMVHRYEYDGINHQDILAPDVFSRNVLVPNIFELLCV